MKEVLKFDAKPQYEQHALTFETLKVPIIGAKYGRRPSGALYRVSSQHTKGSEQSNG